MKEKIQLFLNKYKETVQIAANQLRNQTMPPLTEELFALFEKTGDRLKYEAVYFLRRKYIAVFGMISIMEHKQEDINKLEEVLTEICNEECWALPAHVNRDEGRENSKGNSQESYRDWRITIDLFASETAQTLAEIIAVLGNELSQEIKKLVRENVFRRVLNPFYQSEVPYSSWEECEHNWCSVCGGAIGSASIYMMKDNPEMLSKGINRITESLQHYIAGFGDDGTCMEGIGYFTYGMTYYTGFAAQLYEHTKGDVDLLSGEKCSQIVTFQQKCYFKNGRTVSFSDGESWSHFKVGLTSYLAKRFSQVEIPNMDLAAGFDDDSCYRWASIYRDYIWTKDYLKDHITDMEKENILDKKEIVKNQVILPSAQWSIGQSQNGAGMAAKGGNNGEPHNHNDVGSFLYIAGSDMLLTDLGAGEYTKAYFSEGRYDIFCNSSLSHNVPLINGQTQKDGAIYACDHFAADGMGKTSISFAKAYEDGIISSAVRNLKFNSSNGELSIEDCFEPSKNTHSITENLVTEWKPEVSKNQIIIRGENHGCCITTQNTEVDFTCIRKDHHNHSGHLQDVYLIQWELPINAAEIKCRIHIVPFEL